MAWLFNLSILFPCLFSLYFHQVTNLIVINLIVTYNHSSISVLLLLCLTNYHQLFPNNWDFFPKKLDLSIHSTFFQSLFCQFWRSFAQFSFSFLFTLRKSGFFTATQPKSPDFIKDLLTVEECTMASVAVSRS